ncbi:MAG: hypothetical protein ABGZ23_24635 [Fuerstiella sp.]
MNVFAAIIAVYDSAMLTLTSSRFEYAVKSNFINSGDISRASGDSPAWFTGTMGF